MHLGAGTQQQLHDLLVAVLASIIQRACKGSNGVRSITRASLQVDMGTTIQQESDPGHIALV